MKHLWLRQFLLWGPDIIAMKVTKGTKYDCNFGRQTNQIWVQSLQWGTNMKFILWMQSQLPIGSYMIAMIKNLFPRDSSRNHSHVTLHELQYCNHIKSQLGKIAITIRNWHSNHIWSSFYQDCIHTRSSLRSSLLSYLFPMIQIIAIISSPAQ